MNKLKAISSIFLLACILALAIWLLLKGRGYQAPDHSKNFAFFKEQKRIRDSADNAQRVKDVKHKADSAAQKNKIDSLSNQLSTTKKELGKYQTTTTGLATGVKQAKKEKDTVGYIRRCDSLADEVVGLNRQVDKYKAQADSLQKATDSLQALTQKRLDEKTKLYADMRAAQAAADEKIDKIKKDYEKAAGKAEKKYTIGIGGGAGITTDGKLGGLIGVTVHRVIIRL